MAVEGLDPEVFLRQVWSFNPFWAKHGVIPKCPITGGGTTAAASG